MAAVGLCLGILLAIQGASLAVDAQQPASYQRPPPSPVLDLSRLAKQLKPHEPEQLHLALGSARSIAVSWVTRPQDDEELVTRVAAERQQALTKKRRKDHCDHLADYPLHPTAQLGLASGNYTLEASGSFTCYSSSEYDSGALHTVLLGSDLPLQPGTEYFYRAGDPEYGWSKEFSFVTAPPIGADSVPYRLGLIGDLGQTEDSEKTMKHLDKLDVVSVLNVGDLSYADSYQPRWDSWGRLLEFHAARVPWMHIEGNHEEEVLGGEEGFVAYETRFWYPQVESGSNSPFYYSYETGPMHVIMLGCYVEYLEDSEQAAWLLRDLASIDRSRTPWVVVGMHAPWYNSNTAHQGEVDDMRDALEPFLYQHGVDIVFAGHVHAYERSGGGVYKGRREKCAPTYVTIGDGGNREGLASEYLEKPEWSEVREASFGMGTFTVENRTHAVWRWHRNQDRTSEIADEYCLERTTDCAAVLKQRMMQGGQQPLQTALSGSLYAT